MGNCFGVYSAEYIAGRPPPPTGDEALIRLDGISVAAREFERSSMAQRKQREEYKQQKEAAKRKSDEINKRNAERGGQQSFHL